MDGLRAALRKLPLSQQPHSYPYSVILTFRVDGSCKTRVYDRSNLLPQVQEIYKLTGAPLEATEPGNGAATP